MKKKIFGAALIAAMAATASWNFNQSKNEVELLDFALANVESLAACESSSSSLLNTGYCVKELNSTREICATSGSQYSPRCSGTI